MNFRKLLLTTALTAPLLTTALMVQAGVPDPVALKKIANANNQFGGKLFGLMAKAELAKDKNKNLLFSPFSASIALSMVQNGGVGKTQSEILKSLSLGELTPEAVNEGNQAIIKSLLTNPGNEKVLVANSVWGNTDISNIKKDFVTLTNKYYKTSSDGSASIAREASFADNKTLDDMNSWVKKNTDGMIPTILNKLEPDMSVVLLNALFTQGQWYTPFTKAATKEEDFTTGDGKKSKVQMMHETGSFEFAENEKVTVVSLPFRLRETKAGEAPKLGRFRVDFLALKGIGNKSIEEQAEMLEDSGYHKLITSNPAPVKVKVSIPKFKFDYKRSLVDDLKALGMITAFSGRDADFSLLAKLKGQGNLYVSDVFQKTAIEMDEAGLKAAAVTAVIVARATSVGPVEPEPKVFTADKPFFVSLRDTTTGAVLFVGLVSNPKF